MKLSRFIIKTKYPETNETLLYNTFNGALLAIEPELSLELNEVLKKTQINSIDTELTRELFDEGFIIQDGFDEIEIVKERNRLGINDSNRLDVIIMPNMNCNFACTYCYEDHDKSKMSENTAIALEKWLEQMIPKFKSVLVSWFGGEPTLSFETIVRIQSNVREVTNKNDVDLASHITTNGYLLNEEKAKQLIELGIYSYQITMDGPPKIHDRMRVLKGGKGSFEKVHENICNLVNNHPDANVKLRVNYDDRNIHHIKELLKHFPNKVRSRINLVMERIFGSNYGVFDNSKTDFGQLVEDVYEEARKMGFQTTMSDIDPSKLTYCYADRQNQFVINYNGDIFKCTVSNFESKNRLGSLSENGVIIWERNRLSEWHQIDSFEDKCYKCKFMPLCMGGCRKLRGMFGAVGDDCKLPFEGFENKIRNIYAKELSKG